ncbi:MAG: HNH endonuclease [Bacteriovoracaceae bacterium]
MLKYSEGQASRRVSGARILKELPELAQNLEDGSLNLTQMNQASFFFRDERITSPKEKAAILKKLEGKSTRETDRILHEHRKEAVARNVFIVVKEDTKKKLDKLRDLKAHTCPDNDSLLNKMCEEVTRIWDPTLIKKQSQGSTETRFIPKMVQAEVWRRDNGICTKCGSTYALEYDHVKPFAMGGKSTVENLRLLCRACNQRQRITFFSDKNAFQFKGPSG